MSDSQYDDDVLVDDEIDEEVKEPSMYKVILLNDDYTPMNIVVAILVYVFGKEEEEANAIMLKVHKEGKGIAGMYTYDIARTKQNRAMTYAKSQQFPLKVEIEEE